MSHESNKDLPKLLRAMAQSEDAKLYKHDVILNAAADELEKAWSLPLRIKRLHSWGGQSKAHDYEMVDGTIQTLSEDEARGRY